MDNIFNSSSIQQDNNLSNLTFMHEYSWQEKAVLLMERYFVFILIIAWINNSLVIAVLQTQTYRGTSTGFLLTALACADIGYVSIGATRIWIERLTGYDIITHSSMTCKSHSLVTIMLWGVSAWSLVLITIERLVCVCKPFRVREIFRFRNTVISWVIMTVTLFGFNLHFIWTIELQNGICYRSSFANLNEAKFWEIWVTTNLILTYGIPLCTILSCSVIIVVSIARRAAWRQNTSTTPTDGKISSTTVMLTVNSIVFVLLTGPIQ